MGNEQWMDKLIWAVLSALLAIIAFFSRDWFHRSSRADRDLWQEVNQLKKDVAEIRIAVAGDYATRKELQQLETRLFEEFKGFRADLREVMGPLARRVARAEPRPEKED